MSSKKQPADQIFLGVVDLDDNRHRNDQSHQNNLRKSAAGAIDPEQRWTHAEEKDAHRVQLPATRVHFRAGDGALLPPEAICTDQGYNHRDTMARHREWNSHFIELQSVFLGGGSLEAEQLCDHHPLHRNHHRGSDVGQECPFQRYSPVNARFNLCGSLPPT